MFKHTLNAVRLKKKLQQIITESRFKKKLQQIYLLLERTNLNFWPAAGNIAIGIAMAYCDWSEIPEDILVSIAERLHSLTDYLSAGQACKTWRSSVIHLRIPKSPLLLLAESNPNKIIEREAEELVSDDDVKDVYDDEEEDVKDVYDDEEEDEDEEIPVRGIAGLRSQAGDKICELHLPELHRNRCIGSTGNWLLAVNKEEDITMFNPFSRIQFQLPSASTLPQYFSSEDHLGSKINIRDRFLNKIVLSSPPRASNPDSNGVVAAAIFGIIRQLAFAKPGDKSWMPMHSNSPADHAIDDLVFFKNRVYFINRMGDFAFSDGFHCPSDPIMATKVCEFTKVDADKYYLVEWLGELLLVLKFCPIKRRFPHYKTRGFQVFKFNFHNEDWDEVKCLGQHSLFVGFSTSVALLALPDSTFRKNCIYFSDDRTLGYVGTGIEGGRDMGVYDLQDGTIKPHYAGVSLSLYSPPLWIIPTSLSQA